MRKIKIRNLSLEKLKKIEKKNIKLSENFKIIFLNFSIDFGNIFGKFFKNNYYN